MTSGNRQGTQWTASEWYSEQAAPLKKGQYYVADLIGCDLVHDNKKVGTVVSSMDGAQAVLLEVEALDQKLYMVPYLKEFIGQVNVQDRTIELKAPWILS